MKCITDVVRKCRMGIEKELQNNHIDNALQLISTAAKILYETNQYYVDEELENNLQSICDMMEPLAQTFFAEDTVLFYDGFGLNFRGLAQIYLKALTKIKHVVYVTYAEASDRIPDLLKILQGHEVCFIKGKNYVEKIWELSEIIERFSPSSFFFYACPEDVVATVVLNAYKGKRFLINLTDHAFWLGSREIDTCIEFRDYGASISRDCRGLTNLVKIPFYPIIDMNKEFQGYPFASKGKKVIFSGGSLYKTLGGDNLYYKIVDYILSAYEDAVFWYAGNGDRTEMDKLLAKFPGRAFLTGERADLYQVLRHCYFYLSTYPICGGLMYQYAAIAEKIPLTLKFDQCADGFLLNQEELKIEFDSLEEITREIDRMMTDEGYTLDRGRQIRRSVISEATFNAEVAKLFTDTLSSFPIQYIPVNTTAFRATYVERISEEKIDEIIAQKRNPIAFKYLPAEFMWGGYGKQKEKYSAA